MTAFSPSEIARASSCFVIMPFIKAFPIKGKYAELSEEQLFTIYKLFEELLQKQGYLVTRSDSVGDILSDIVSSLQSADLVCADLTGLNPNVMYELGIRHGFTKKTLLFTQDRTELPFDLSKYYCIEYGWQTFREKEKLMNDIEIALRTIENNPNVKFGPVHSYLGVRAVAYSEQEKWDFLDRLDAVAGELTLLKKLLEVIFIQAVTSSPLIKKQAIEKQGDGSLAISKADIPKELYESEAPLTEHDVNTLSAPYPAIAYHIARNSRPRFFDKYGDINSFNSVLRQFWAYLPRRKGVLVSNILVAKELSQMLHIDSAKLREAIGNDRYGINLELKSKEFILMTSEKENIQET